MAIFLCAKLVTFCSPFMTSVKVTKMMDSDKPKNCESYKKRIIILNRNQNYLRIISERKIRGKHVVTNALQCWGEYKEPPLWRRILILVGRARRSIRVNFHKDWGRRKKRKNAAAYDQPGSNVHEVSLMLVNVANWSRSSDCPIWSGKFCFFGSEMSTRKCPNSSVLVR